MTVHQARHQTLPCQIVLLTPQFRGKCWGTCAHPYDATTGHHQVPATKGFRREYVGISEELHVGNLMFRRLFVRENDPPDSRRRCYLLPDALPA